MKRANMARFCSIVPLIAVLYCAQLTASAQTIVQANPPSANRVRLVMGTDPQFDSLIQQRLPEIAASARYQLIKKTSVVVVNDTAFKVKAMALKWWVTQADGTQTVSYSCVCPPPLGKVFLPGRLPALLPSHVALVSPLGHAEDSITASRAASASALDAAYVNGGSVPAVLGAQQLKVAIDSIVFGNDSVVGSDSFGLLDKFTCERNGAIAEAQSLVPLTKDPTALTRQLNTDAALSGTSATIPCGLGRASEARRLLQLQQSGHSKAVSVAIQTLAGARQVSLHRGR
jgi:hypothetical protein